MFLCFYYCYICLQKAIAYIWLCKKGVFTVQKLFFWETKRGFLQAKKGVFAECVVTFLLTDNYILVFGTMFLTTLPLCFAFV